MTLVSCPSQTDQSQILTGGPEHFYRTSKPPGEEGSGLGVGWRQGLISLWPTPPEPTGRGKLPDQMAANLGQGWCGAGRTEPAPVLAYLAVLTLPPFGHPRLRLSPGVSHSRLLTDGLSGVCSSVPSICLLHPLYQPHGFHRSDPDSDVDRLGRSHC